MKIVYLLVALIIISGISLADTNVTASAANNGNLILNNNTSELNLSVTNNNSEYGDEITSILITTSAFSISNSSDDDSEGDWVLTGNTLSGNTIIPGETVNFTLNISSLGNPGIYEMNITATDNSTNQTTVTKHLMVINPGYIEVQVKLSNNSKATINSAYLLTKNDTSMDTSFSEYPDTINENDSIVSPQEFSNGFIIFNQSTLNLKNASGTVYINISTGKGRIKYSFSYNNETYNQINIISTKLETYYDSGHLSNTTEFSSRNNAHNIVYVYVNGSSGSLSGKIYNLTNTTERVNMTFSESNGIGNLSVFNENATALRMDISNGTYTFFKYLSINRTKPNQVENLSSYAYPNNGTIFLNWSQISADYYKIYRNGTFIGNSTTLNYTDYSAALNTTYMYNVSAVNYLGNEGNLSLNTTNTTSGADRQPPTAVSVFAATAKANGAVFINWSKPSGEPVNAYIVWRNSTSQNWTNIANLSSTARNYTDTGLTGNTTYSYKIEVNDTSNNKINSTAVSVMPDSESPVWTGAGAVKTAILKTDKDNDGIAEIGDVIEINITKLYDVKMDSGDHYTISNVSANLSRLGGSDHVYFTNLTEIGGIGNANYTLMFTIKSGNVNGSLNIPLTAVDDAGNSATVNVTLNNVYNYKSRISYVEIRNHSSTNVVSGSLSNDTWYDVFTTVNTSEYRGDTYLITEVNDSSGMVYFGYQFIPSTKRNKLIRLTQGFRATRNVSISIFLWNAWTTSSSYYALALPYRISRAVS